MRQSNNKHYDTNGGLLGHPTNVSSHPKPPVSKEDETMKTYKTLKGTDWKITPSHGYVKLINGERAHISRYYAYTSRKGNDYKTTYRVQKGDKYLGQRNRFRDAMALAEGGE
jgi:LysM repeat protein